MNDFFDNNYIPNMWVPAGKQLRKRMYTAVANNQSGDSNTYDKHGTPYSTRQLAAIDNDTDVNYPMVYGGELPEVTVIPEAMLGGNQYNTVGAFRDQDGNYVVESHYDPNNVYYSDHDSQTYPYGREQYDRTKADINNDLQTYYRYNPNKAVEKYGNKYVVDPVFTALDYVMPSTYMGFLGDSNAANAIRYLADWIPLSWPTKLSKLKVLKRLKRTK